MSASAVAIEQFTFFDGVTSTREAVEVRADDYAYLRLSSEPEYASGDREIRVVDLFSGCGGISLGVREACHALGVGFQSKFAADFETDALATYVSNFHPSSSTSQPLNEILSMPLRARLTSKERKLGTDVGDVDVLVGGPPCQGHSDLNNNTRRADPKNSLYSLMARAAEVFEPAHIIIENVLGAAHDRAGVVHLTRERLEELGYATSLGIVDAAAIGIPQRRRRLVLLASRGRVPIPVDQLATRASLPIRDLSWAIADLQTVRRGSILDEPAKPAPDTVRRIDHLFDNGLYELPDDMRPPCHRNKRHTYKSIYGRLRWDQPAQTITSGFYSMCMGRYVHPSERRTLTAHEASRLQFFPDFFDFSPVANRTSLAQIIGNAVPMKLAYVAALSLLGEALG